ncbi:GIY-YIG nuclease family protein [Nocardia farcinica]|uniref:Bacteriophage T5 Orf172 DNA-binding domain-containing protein n=1 Tax=Nocardia farcinica (strain IFM 10152) TaxID=247156 RepID=Q5YY34_NOCFA|nr:GIY-YIG nuclease family protein [Nocardia farcinica]BAD56907.1 hypothetical protein NFA_20610 [Nocardia farcinica IFM 10152]
MHTPSRRGVVYVLMNRAMPGYMKIGKTIKTSDERARQLSGATGVPEDFEIVFDIVVSDVDQVEKLAHKKLDYARTNKRREFFRVDIRAAIQTVTEIASRFPVAEADSISREILPQMETRMRRWLRRDIISVEFVQYSDLCILRVTEQPNLRVSYARSIAFNLEVLGGGFDEDGDGFLFSPYRRSIDENVKIFAEELDAYSMAMVDIPLLSPEATRYIVDGYEAGDVDAMRPDECVIRELWLEGWTIDVGANTSVASDLRLLDRSIKHGITIAGDRQNGWPQSKFYFSKDSDNEEQ